MVRARAKVRGAPRDHHAELAHELDEPEAEVAVAAVGQLGQHLLA
tara:strand:- start:212 stop:346 length:135 start_codon:yes stop_codon:yes gene_type:complete